jgi:hypothetical protein
MHTARRTLFNRGEVIKTMQHTRESIQGCRGKGGRSHLRYQLAANATLDEAFLQAAPWDALEVLLDW